MKKAIIVVKLVPESGSVSDTQITEEILAEARIPWLKDIEQINIRRLKAHERTKPCSAG